MTSLKLERVRALMEEEGLDALVVRAPDNVLYLTNFWADEGLRRRRLPARGRADARSASRRPRKTPSATPGRTDVRFLRGYADDDPRPPAARTLGAGPGGSARSTARVGLELSLGTQASDRMVGEPTTFTHDWFEGFGRQVADATPLLARARAVKTDAGAGAHAPRQRDRSGRDGVRREHLRPGMKESRAPRALMWNGFVHGAGTGWKGRSSWRSGSRSSGRGLGIKTFTATGDLPVQEDEPTLFEIWVCADGYWCDHTKNLCPGELRPEYAELERRLLAVYERRDRPLSAGREPRRARPTRFATASPRRAIPASRATRVAHGVGARAHEPPYAHQAGGGTIEEGMVLAIEPGIYWEGGGGLARRGQLPRQRRAAPRSSPRFPDGVVCG